jgi:hypothetical protein
MNGLVIINNAILANLFIEVAKSLQDIGHKIYVVTDSQFTLSKFRLDELGFSGVFVFEDYLNTKKVERTTGYNSWNIHSDFDRNNYYHSVSGQGLFWADVSSNLYSFFEKTYKDNIINFSFYENVSNGLAETALLVGEKLNIKYFGLTSSRLPGRMLFTDDEVRLANEIRAIADRLDLESLENNDLEFVRSYLSNLDTIQPDYMKTNGLSSSNFIRRVFKKRDLRETLTSILYGARGSNTFQMGNPIVKSFYFNKREIIRTFCAKWLNSKYTESSQHSSFYIYPLHYHPESSTSILAKYYDEYQLIKNIAFSLPHGHVLYVKDHISANGYEGFSFYKKIMKLPNVKLLAPRENTKQLIRKAKGVFTLTSTVGYEAVLLNKPVVVFGDVFYSEHPLVFKASGYRDIKTAIEFINEPPSVEKMFNEKFVSAYLSQTFSLTVDYRVKNIALKDKGREIAKIVNEKITQLQEE